MSLSKSVFNTAFALLCDRYGRQNLASGGVTNVYYGFLSQRFTDDNFEDAVCLWIVNQDKFPSPRELADYYRGMLPPNPTTLEKRGSFYHELSEEDRHLSDAARARIRQMLQVNERFYVESSTDFSSIGDIAAEFIEPSVMPHSGQEERRNVS